MEVDGKLTPCSCNECEYMRMNTLEKLYKCLRDETNEIIVDEEIAAKAVSCIEKMLQMSV
jgi:quinolinate synthase